MALQLRPGCSRATGATSSRTCDGRVVAQPHAVVVADHRRAFAALRPVAAGAYRRRRRIHAVRAPSPSGCRACSACRRALHRSRPSRSAPSACSMLFFARAGRPRSSPPPRPWRCATGPRRSGRARSPSSQSPPLAVASRQARSASACTRAPRRRSVASATVNLRFFKTREPFPHQRSSLTSAR